MTRVLCMHKKVEYEVPLKHLGDLSELIQVVLALRDHMDDKKEEFEGFEIRGACTPTDTPVLRVMGIDTFEVRVGIT